MLKYNSFRNKDILLMFITHLSFDTSVFITVAER